MWTSDLGFALGGSGGLGCCCFCLLKRLLSGCLRFFPCFLRGVFGYLSDFRLANANGGRLIRLK